MMSESGAAGGIVAMVLAFIVIPLLVAWYDDFEYYTHESTKKTLHWGLMALFVAFVAAMFYFA